MINVFGLYWGLFFFTAFGELVLAGVFAEVNIVNKHVQCIILEYVMRHIKRPDIQNLTLFFAVVLVQRQVLHAQLCPGLCLMERYG